MKKLLFTLLIFLCCSTISFAQLGLDSLRVNDYLVITNNSGDTLAIFQSSGVTFPQGIASQTSELSFDAIAWFPPSDDDKGILDTLSATGDGEREEVYLFADSGTPELWLKLYIPTWASEIDSAWIWTTTANTDGDSSAFNLLSTGTQNEGESAVQQTVSVVRDTIEYSASTANLFTVLKFAPWPSSIQSTGYVYIVLQRNNSIANNIGDDVRFHAAVFFIH